MSREEEGVIELRGLLTKETDVTEADVKRLATVIEMAHHGWWRRKEQTEPLHKHIARAVVFYLSSKASV